MYISDTINLDFSENPRGNRSDLEIINQTRWLHDTEVRYVIDLKKGRWHLSMIYIYLHNPMRFVCRYIDNYESFKKAELYAQIFQRGIRKDARGTLKIDDNAYNICFN